MPRDQKTMSDQSKPPKQLLHQAVANDTVHRTRRAKTARRIWQVGDHVRVKNGQGYDGQLGEIYCVPSERKFWWAYTVNLFARNQPHDCVFCAFDEMEPIDFNRAGQLVAGGVFTFDQMMELTRGTFRDYQKGNE